MSSPIQAARDPRTVAELTAGVWEQFSALLFISAVYPEAAETAWPVAIFVASLLVSAALGRAFMARGQRGYVLAGALRMASWLLALAGLLPTGGFRLLAAALVFGVMAFLMRRGLYRHFLDPQPGELDDATLGATMRARLSESAAMAGVVGGHAMLLFTVAFLRTRSSFNFEMWFEVVPVLALPGTLGFTFAVRLATGVMVPALRAGPKGEPALLSRGLAQALALPSVLSYLNFVVWFGCTALGILRMRPGPAAWTAGDAILQLAFASLFAWGVSFYQRAWHRDTVEPAVDRLRRWLGVEERAEEMPLRRRMLRDFGLPLLFACALSLLSSIALYRALGSALTATDNFNAVSALFGAFTALVLAVGGVVYRAAGELSRPMVQLAQAADRVAHGQLDAAVPRVHGPVEVVGLGESVERMREGLARTIGELEKERAGLEANVEARTAELRHTLAELEKSQAALIQGERLASIGELVAGVAHEINNPLNAIAGASAPLGELCAELEQMLEAYRAAEEELPPARRKELQTLRKKLDVEASLEDLAGISTVIRRATDRSVKIVQNLRSFSRASGEPVPSDLHAGLEETLMLLAPRLRQAGIRVEKRLGELPEVVCRPGEMNQVFMNLLVNAIQAIEQLPQRPGEAGSIVIETRLEAGAAVLAVTDSGAGVPEEIARRIFDPFFTTKPRGQGTGLGLSISTDIARRHGGTLSLEPAAAGARFVVRIPVGRRTSPSRPEPS